MLERIQVGTTTLGLSIHTSNGIQSTSTVTPRDRSTGTATHNDNNTITGQSTRTITQNGKSKSKVTDTATQDGNSTAAY